MTTRLLLSLIFGLGALGIAKAQHPTADSLKTVLATSVGEQRLNVLNALSFSLREIEQQSAFEYALEADSLAQSLNNKSAEAKAKESIGWIYYRRGQWQKTFDYSKKAYELSIEVNDLEEAARVLNNMGALYYEQQNYTSSLNQFKKAYEISTQAHDLYTKIRSLNNLALTYINFANLDSAMHFALKAIETNREAGSPYLLTFSNRIIGDIYFQRNQLDAAEKIYREALENAKKQGLTAFNASVLHRLGNTYLLNGKSDQAKDVLLECVKISSQNGFLDELSKAHKYLAEFYRQRGNYKEAFKQQSAFVILNDSLVNKSSRDRLALVQGMFQNDLDQSQLELLIAQNEVQASSLASNRKFMILVSSGSILVLGLLIWLFYLNRNIKKYNKDLIIQKEQIHKQNEDLEAKSKQLQDINQTKNKLFSILGHDLRGPVGQVKSIVDLLVAGELNQDEFDELIQNMKKDVDSVYFTLNNTLKWSVAQMEGFKIQKANFNLSELVKSTLKQIAPQLREKSIEIDSSSLFSDIEIYADRNLVEVIIRNVLNNAIKYSKPGDVIELSIKVDNDLINCCVKDQGIGMGEDQINELLSPDYVISNSKLGTKMEKGSGLGLQICKEFARMNGGELHINSTVGMGTKVCFKIPGNKLLFDN